MSVNVVKIEDLMEIAEFLSEKSFSTDNIVVEIDVDDEKLFNRINDDFYYRYGMNKFGEKPDGIKEITINIIGVKFKYVLKNDMGE